MGFEEFDCVTRLRSGFKPVRTLSDIMTLSDTSYNVSCNYKTTHGCAVNLEKTKPGQARLRGGLEYLPFARERAQCACVGLQSQS